MKNKDTQQGTPEKAKNKRLYYIIIAACALVLAAAITFTVVMVTRDAPVSIEEPIPTTARKIPKNRKTPTTATKTTNRPTRRSFSAFR